MLMEGIGASLRRGTYFLQPFGSFENMAPEGSFGAQTQDFPFPFAEQADPGCPPPPPTAARAVLVFGGFGGTLALAGLGWQGESLLLPPSFAAWHFTTPFHRTAKIPT